MKENAALLKQSRFAHKSRNGNPRTIADEDVGLDRSRESLLNFGGIRRQACVLGIIRDSKPAATMCL